MKKSFSFIVISAMFLAGLPAMAQSTSVTGATPTDVKAISAIGLTVAEEISWTTLSQASCKAVYYLGDTQGVQVAATITPTSEGKFLHKALLNNLKPEATYSYDVYCTQGANVANKVGGKTFTTGKAVSAISLAARREFALKEARTSYGNKLNLAKDVLSKSKQTASVKKDSALKTASSTYSTVFKNTKAQYESAIKAVNDTYKAKLSKPNNSLTVIKSIRNERAAAIKAAQLEYAKKIKEAQTKYSADKKAAADGFKASVKSAEITYKAAIKSAQEEFAVARNSIK